MMGASQRGLTPKVLSSQLPRRNLDAASAVAGENLSKVSNLKTGLAWPRPMPAAKAALCCPAAAGPTPNWNMKLLEGSAALAAPLPEWSRHIMESLLLISSEDLASGFSVSDSVSDLG